MRSTCKSEKPSFPKISLIRTLILLTGFAMLQYLSGCGTANPPPPAPISGHDLQVFMASGRNPQIFGVRTFKTPFGIGAKNAGNIKGARTDILEFKSSKKSPLPVIEVTTKGRNGRDMLIDTSSRKSWVSFPVAKEYGMVPAGKQPASYTARHVNGSKIAFLCIAPQIEFDKMTLTEGLFYALADHESLWPVSRDYRHDDIEMVLGCGMLKAFAFARIDFKNRSIVLSASDKYPLPNDRIVASAPIVWENGAVAIDCEIDGVEQTAYIDTGGAFQIARRNPESASARTVKIKDLVFPTPSISPAKDFLIDRREMPSLGAELFQDYIITIDMVEQMIHFEHPPA